mmetsp:Transcript_17121/g.36737  ORF Transcript_17121/g.36737 Transcript_17121/m.36737 type:complete len:81 (-) Transcript_17121:674-916(-)
MAASAAIQHQIHPLQAAAINRATNLTRLLLRFTTHDNSTCMHGRVAEMVQETPLSPRVCGAMSACCVALMTLLRSNQSAL